MTAHQVAIAADVAEACAPAYAKLTRPRLHQAMARPRLFALLDQLRARHQVLWLASPPGAGKTTLAASYLAHCGAPSLWCQLDGADADPATLFFFLSEAMRATPGVQWTALRAGHGRGDPVPLFFRHFYAHLPPGAIVVFDNMHDFDWDNAGALLETALAEVPDGVTVMVLGRDAPPPQLVRMELSGRLHVVGYKTLRLDLAEARALAGVGASANPAALEWLGLVDGWAAGIVMLRTLADGAEPMPPLLKQREAVFRYFAGEILHRMPARRQALLMMLSFLPEACAADALALTGEQDAVRLLDELYRQRLFVERRGEQQVSYQFQTLFGEFLQRQAAGHLAPELLTRTAARAAAIAEARGRIEDAAVLLQRAGAPGELARLLRRHAAPLIAAGRGESWRLWMSWLDATTVDAEPCLWYWHGLSLIELRPAHARAILLRAERAFSHQQDAVARLMTQAAIIDSYDGEWSDLSALPHWIGQLAAGLSALEPGSLEPWRDLRLHARLVGALLAQAPESPLLVTAAERALRLMHVVDDPLICLGAAGSLLHYFEWQGCPARAIALIADMDQMVDDPALSPAHLVRWYAQVARWYSREGELGQAQQTAQTARRIVHDFALDPLQCQTLDIQHMLRTGDLAGARTQLDAIREALPMAAAPQQAECSALEAHWRALSGDVEGAVKAAADTVRLSGAGVMPASERARFAAFFAACLAWQGNTVAAVQCYQEAASAVQGLQSHLLQEECQFVQALACALAGDDAQAGAPLRAALEQHRLREGATLFPMVPALASQIAALALEHQIEVPHVLGLITRQQLAAPRRAIPGWPWAVAVRTLGPVTIALQGEALVASGKSQQRPLALLKSLVAAGEGGKSQQVLLAQLWGNADVARSALSVTVHRLRKLLRNDAVVIVSGGWLRFCPDKVWSDVGALGQLCEEIADLPQGQGDTVRLAEALLDLYRGPFCDGCDDSWVLPERERVRKLFLSAVARLGQRLEEGGAWRAGLALYQRALDAEPLAEENHRGAMRCVHALEGGAAAFAVYRRCRETLSILLGIAPSAKTEQLAASLGLK